LAGKVAVMIIDMQEEFFYDPFVSCSAEFHELIKANQDICHWAKINKVPAIVVEMSGWGNTLSELKKQIQVPYFRIKKKKCSVFKEDNQNEIQVLKQLGIETLLIGGISSGACIKLTIEDALPYFSIILPDNAHAGINGKRIVFHKDYPYSDLGPVSSCLGLIDAARISPEAYEAYKAKILASQLPPCPSPTLVR